MKNSHNCRTAMTPVTVCDLPLDIVFSVSLCLSSHFSLLNSKEKLAHKKKKKKKISLHFIWPVYKPLRN